MTREWQLSPQDYRTVSLQPAQLRAFLAERISPSRMGIHEIVFGELATNAVRYGRRPRRARVTIRAGTVVKDVEDSGDCFDLDLRLAERLRYDGGRGLAFVDHLAVSFRVSHDPDTMCHVAAVVAL